MSYQIVLSFTKVATQFPMLSVSETKPGSSQLLEWAQCAHDKETMKPTQGCSALARLAGGSRHPSDVGRFSGFTCDESRIS